MPSHALYAAGTSLLPLAVFVSTTTAISYVALPDKYPSVGCSRASYLPPPRPLACTANPPLTNPPYGALDAASEPLLISKLSGIGAGEMRSSRNTSVNDGSASTDAAFCPSPPASSTTTCRSCATLPDTVDWLQLAAMLVRKRCFFTVAYSRCCVSRPVTAGRPYRASDMLLPACSIRSCDGLAWALRKSQSTPLAVYVNKGSIVSRPSSNLSRDSTNSESASTSDDRNWQSPLKSPHTRAVHGSHASSRRAVPPTTRGASCRVGSRGPPPSMRRRPAVRLAYPCPATTAAY